MDRIDFLKYFDDIQLKPRAGQTYILEQISELWDKYKYIIISAPTGIGKTHIALAIANALGKSYILTHTKQLQDQYLTTSSKVVNLKGRGNYNCNINPAFMVDAAPCLVAKNIKAQCLREKTCSYYNQVEKALAAQTMITNYAYFLYSTHCGVLSDEGIEPRNALIMDEAHILESLLVSFARIDVDTKELHEKHGVDCEDITFTEELDYNRSQLAVLIEKVQKRCDDLKATLETEFNPSNKEMTIKLAKAFSAVTSDKVKKLNAKLYHLDKILQSLIIYQTSRDISEWVEKPIFEKGMIEIGETEKICLAPLKATNLFSHYMGKTAEKFVFISATIDSKMIVDELGIPAEEVLFIDVDSPFEPSKSPVIFMPTCKMNFSEIDKNHQKIAGTVAEILEHHTGEKGIIHSGNYKISGIITANIHNEQKGRLLHRDMTYGKKMINEDLFKLHKRTDQDTVLLSPSMTTGIDLADDLSRFQIIVKLPFLSLGEPRVEKKSKMSSYWYENAMWLEVLQSSGRSTRNEDDHSITYILDSSFRYFYDKNRQYLPQWFTKRVVFIS